jgi:hypothetical protein
MSGKYIPIIDFVLVAWVTVWGAVGGLGGGAVEAVRSRALPPWTRLVVYSAIGVISAVGAFSALAITSFVLDDGAVDMLRLAGYSVAAGAGVAGALAGVNLGVGTAAHYRHLDDDNGKK